MNLTAIILSILLISGCAQSKISSPEEISDLVCFWDFQKAPDGKVNLTSKGRYNYTLKEMNGPIELDTEGVFGPSSLKIRRGQWLMIKREECPGLNIFGKQEVSMVAWIKRKGDNHWQYIAGMWNERDAQRQYALFFNGHRQTDYTTLERTEADNQPHGYVSDVGGATPNRPFCFSYATGKTKIEKDDSWYMLAYTYDHRAVKVYLNGEFDSNGNYNPFFWDKTIFDGGSNGSDFTVAQRALPKWPGYPEVEEPTHPEGFDGVLGGLAVYNRALTADEIKKLYDESKDGMGK
jgi:hypothetical protein